MTRQYNKSAHKHHYSQAVGPVRKRKGAAASVSADPELETEGDNLNAADSDVDSDEEVINALKVVCLSVCHCMSVCVSLCRTESKLSPPPSACYI